MALTNCLAGILQALPWFAWIPIVAIIGATITGVVRMSITHRERMAMMRHGINPDTPAAKPYETSEL
jgi:hypothetical protein